MSVGRPRTEDPDRVATSVRLPRDLHDRVTAAAAERGVGVNWLITRLLVEGMERLVPVADLRLTRPAGGEGRD